MNLATAQKDDILRSDVVVLGAGIIGVVVALELQRRGRQTLLIDKDGPAAGCSFGNGGAIGQNNCIPFALPGILRKLPRWYLDPDGPVTVDPRWAIRSIPWIMKWTAASRKESARKSSKRMKYLHAGCLKAYREYLGADCYEDLIREQGYLYVYEGETLSRNEEFAAILRKELGVSSTSVSAGEIQELEPALGTHFKRGLFLDGNGHTTNPKRLVETLCEKFMAIGGTFLQADVHAFDADGGYLRALRSSIGEIPARNLVLCAGAWSRNLARKLGANLPLVAERGYHVTFKDSPIELNHKVMNGSRGFGATSMETGLQITGTVELSDVEAGANWRRAESLKKAASQMFKTQFSGKTSLWMGPRPSLPDSIPVIDRSPSFKNVVFNFGHSHWGLSGAPRSARISADMIDGRRSEDFGNAFSVGRFQ